MTSGPTYYYYITSLSSAGESPQPSSVVSARSVIQDGNWTFTYTGTNAATPQATPPTGAEPMAISSNGALVAESLVYGTVSASTTTNSTASAQGTWTATWVPNTSTSWPTLFALNHTVAQTFQAESLNASGTTTVYDNIAKKTVVSATWPLTQSETPSTATPTGLTSWTATDPTTVVETLTNTLGGQQEDASGAGWDSSSTTSNRTTTIYTFAGLQNYMTAHNESTSSPSNLVITLPAAAAQNYTSTTTMTSSTSSSAYLASAAGVSDAATGS